MITNLTEQDILDYLMTSDFTEGLTPDEFKFLLIKFRNFYRISNGRNEYLKGELDAKLKEIADMKTGNERTINNILSEKVIVENELHSVKNRELSWKERIKGKIILTKDEEYKKNKL